MRLYFSKFDFLTGVVLGFVRGEVVSKSEFSIQADTVDYSYVRICDINFNNSAADKRQPKQRVIWSLFNRNLKEIPN